MAVRIISAIVAIVFAIVVLLLASTFVFNIVVGAISVVMIHELMNAIKFPKKAPVIVAMVNAMAIPVLLGTDYAEYTFIVSSVCIFLIFLEYIFHHEDYKAEQIFFLVGGMMMITYSMSCLIRIKDIDDKHGVLYVVVALCGAWLADTGAYFTGTFLGKHKLCPKISPKKTVEGLIGGVIITGILFDVIYAVYKNFITSYVIEVNYITLFVLGAICALIGTIGDLSASLIKRQFEIKDYGKIMPGHGGLLDRFDSVLFVVPFFYAFICVFSVLN